MEQSDLLNFSKLMHKVSSYYKEPVSEFIIELWFDAFMQYEIRDISIALLQWIKKPQKNNAFMPKIADIMSYFSVNIDVEALEAWNSAHAAVRRHGPYQSLYFENGIIGKIIFNLGGWIKFCSMLNDHDMPFIQKRFVENYKLYAEQKINAEDFILKGIIDSSNGKYENSCTIPDMRENSKTLQLSHDD